MPPVPVKLSAARAPGSVAPKVVAKAVVRPRILVVDDTPSALQQIRDCLKSLNNECFSAGSGQSALDFLTKEMVDIIIADVSMPGMDGFELCRQLKQGERTRNIPFILLTGDLKSEDIHRGLQLGALDFLTKPAEPNEYTARIHAALQVKRLFDELNVQLLDPDAQKLAQAELQQKTADFQHGMTTAHWNVRFGQLAASFLDELRAPLTHGLATLQPIMVDDQIREDVRLQLMQMHKELSNARDQLRRLVNVAVYSRSQQLLCPAEIAAEAVRLLYPEFGYYGIAIDLQVDPTVQWWGMRSELSRAILYLLHNAIEAHTDKGPIIKRHFEDDKEEETPAEETKRAPSVTVVVERAFGYVFIHVRDNGPGIKPDLQDKIWDPHFTTKTPPHTGAGLHLARAIVRAGGGDIELKSPGPDCSTQFSIKLPINTKEFEAAESSAPAEETSGEAEPETPQEEPVAQA